MPRREWLHQIRDATAGRVSADDFLTDTDATVLQGAREALGSADRERGA